MTLTILASNQSNNYPKGRPVGEYDNRILCKECEKRFGVWDNYAKVLLLDSFHNFQAINDEKEVVGYQVGAFDYEKLKLFFISVLWRASVSQREFYKLVSLGEDEHIIRDMILNQNPGTKDEYSVGLFRFTGVNYGVPIIMPVEINTTYSFKYNRIYLGSYFFDIKISAKATPGHYGLGEIEDGQPLVIACKNIKSMNEYRILKLVANAPHNENAI